MRFVVVIALALATSRSSFGQSADSPASTPAEATQAAPPVSRAMESPLPSPPFPSSEWAGSPIIGLPDTTPDYPLQKALFGEGIVKLYRLDQRRREMSTSKKSNIPMAYDVAPNSLQLDQAVLRLERQPDTVQRDRTDWGFRVTGFYGIDTRYTVAKGWQPASDSVLKHNSLYAFDPVEVYGLLYVPGIAQGLVIKVGRYISPPDIEAQLAPDNYLYTHSLMFSYDPFTFTGGAGDRAAQFAMATRSGGPRRQRSGAVGRFIVSERAVHGAVGVERQQRFALGRNQHARSGAV